MSGRAVANTLLATLVVLPMTGLLGGPTVWGNEQEYRKRFSVVDDNAPGDPPRYVVYYHRKKIKRLYVRNFIRERLRTNPSAGTAISRAEQTQIEQQLNTDLDLILEALRTATERFQAMGLSRRALRPVTHGGHDYFRVDLHEFKGERRTKSAGVVLRESHQLSGQRYSRILINVRLFLAGNRNPDRIRSVVAHELFHAVQHAYCPNFPPWFKESTAVWAAHQVYPHYDSKYGKMATHVRFMEHAMTEDDRYEDDPAKGYRTSVRGRPYGTAVFWRFFNQQDDLDAVAIIRETMQRAGPEESQAGSAMDALSRTLGDAQPLGEKFRNVFGRYAVGAFLGPEAPLRYRIQDVNRLVTAEGGRSRYPYSRPYRLSRPMLDFYEDGPFQDPSTALMQLRPNPVQRAPNTQWNVQTVLVRSALIEVAGCGTRYFSIARPPFVDLDAPLQLVVEAGRDEAAVYAFARYGEAWKIVQGSYSQAAGGHAISLPTLGRITSRNAYVALCRFDRAETFKAFPLRISLAAPPRVKHLKITQGDRTVYEAIWSAPTTPGKQAAARYHVVATRQPLLPEGGDAQLVIELSTPIQQSSTPVCQVDGQEIRTREQADGTRRVGEIPASMIKADATQLELRITGVSRYRASVPVRLPLDTDPSTVAILSPGTSRWNGYERDANGHVITLPVGELETAPGLTLQMLPPLKRGEPERLRVICPALASLSKDQPYKAYEIIAYASQSSSGPFTPFRRIIVSSENTTDTYPGGLVNSTTYDMHASANIYDAYLRMVARERKEQYTRPQEKPLHYQVGVRRIDLRLPKRPPGPEGTSHVASPGKAKVCVRGAVPQPDSTAILHAMMMPFDFSLGLSISVSDQKFDYHGVKFAVTIGDQTFYGFSDPPGRNTWYESEAWVGMPYFEQPVKATILASGQDLSAKTDLTIVPQFAAPLEEIRNARQQKVSRARLRHERYRTERLQAKINLLTTEVGKATKKLADVRGRKNPPATPAEIAIALKAYQHAEQQLEWEGHWRAELARLEHDDELASIRLEWDAVVAIRRAIFDHRKKYYASNPAVQDRRSQLHWRGMKVELLEKIAEAARKDHDGKAYRSVVEEELLPAMAEAERLGVIPNKQRRADLHITAAESIAWLTGDQTAAKAHVLRARELLAYSPSEVELLPNWWPRE